MLNTVQARWHHPHGCGLSFVFDLRVCTSRAFRTAAGGAARFGDAMVPIPRMSADLQREVDASDKEFVDCVAGDNEAADDRMIGLVAPRVVEAARAEQRRALAVGVAQAAFRQSDLVHDVRDGQLQLLLARRDVDHGQQPGVSADGARMRALEQRQAPDDSREAVGQ